MANYELYTDGSFRKGFGAWGFIVLKDGEIVFEDYQGDYNTTINRMELRAIKEGLEHIPEGEEVHVFTDSQYAANCCAYWIKKWMKAGWMTLTGSPVVNRPLLESLWERALKVKGKYYWIRGHNGNQYNEMVDEKVQEITKAMVERHLRLHEPIPEDGIWKP